MIYMYSCAVRWVVWHVVQWTNCHINFFNNTLVSIYTHICYMSVQLYTVASVHVSNNVKCHIHLVELQFVIMLQSVRATARSMPDSK